jgi:hypothetical protein
VDDWEAQERFENAVRALPVEPYLGLLFAEARARAESEHRVLRVLDSLDGPRHLDLVPIRLNVELDADGCVQAVDAG